MRTRRARPVTGGGLLALTAGCAAGTPPPAPAIAPSAVPGPSPQARMVCDGSAVMRKEDKVLLVDVVDLPDPFGRPPVARGEAALRITKAVLGGWTGA